MVLGLERELPSPLLPSFSFPSFSFINEICILFKIKNRRDDAYWPEGKRMAMEDRYRPDFPRPDHRFHDFDHRDRGQYQEHVADRSVPRPTPTAVIGFRLFLNVWCIREVPSGCL